MSCLIGPITLFERSVWSILEHIPSRSRLGCENSSEGSDGNAFNDVKIASKHTVRVGDAVAREVEFGDPRPGLAKSTAASRMHLRLSLKVIMPLRSNPCS